MFCSLGVDTRELANRLTDDHQLPFDSRPHHVVTKIVLHILARDEAVNVLDGSADVV